MAPQIPLVGLLVLVVGGLILLGVVFALAFLLIRWLVRERGTDAAPRDD